MKRIIGFGIVISFFAVFAACSDDETLVPPSGISSSSLYQSVALHRLSQVLILRHRYTSLFFCGAILLAQSSVASVSALSSVSVSSSSALSSVRLFHPRQCVIL